MSVTEKKKHRHQILRRTESFENFDSAPFKFVEWKYNKYFYLDFEVHFIFIQFHTKRSKKCPILILFCNGSF